MRTVVDNAWVRATGAIPLFMLFYLGAFTLIGFVLWPDYAATGFDGTLALSIKLMLVAYMGAWTAWLPIYAVSRKLGLPDGPMAILLALTAAIGVGYGFEESLTVTSEHELLSDGPIYGTITFFLALPVASAFIRIARSVPSPRSK